MSAPPPSSADRPLVTFFVMAYRQEALVREAVESAFAQTWPNLEIILSDDNSPDATFRIMQEMAAAYDGPHRVILNRNPVNLGVVPHIDRIMQLASGDLIVQNAGDDTSRPDRVERLMALRDATTPRPTLVYSAATVIDAEGRRIGERVPKPLMREAPTPANLIRHRLVALGAASAWGREAFEVFGPMGGDLGVEDTVLPFRAALLGGIAYTEEELIGWRADGASWAPSVLSARERLYGIELRLARWRAQNARHILTRFAHVDYPDKATVEAACREEAERLGFVADLADATRLGRLALLPRALRAAFATRSTRPVRILLQYLFDGPYMRWWDARHGIRAQATPTRGATS